MFDHLFARWDQPDSPGCAVAVIQDGAVTYSRCFGLASLEHRAPITPQTVFRVASLSKQFTGACVALLASESRLRLDDDVRRYIPELPDWGATITLRHLLHFTSGIQDFPHLVWGMAGIPFGDQLGEGEVLALLSRLSELDFPPGEQFHYCNAGYFLLSVVVKRVTGQSLRHFAAERLFAPLGMAHTHFHDDPWEVVPGRAGGYMDAPGGSYRLADMPTNHLVGDDGLFTTLEDLCRWDRCLREGELGPEVTALMLTPGRLNDGKPVRYGCGLFLTEREGQPVVWHYGEFLGFQSAYRCFPGLKLSVIILGNQMSLPALDLAMAIEDELLGARQRFAEETPPEPVPSWPLEMPERYTGVFANRELPATYQVYLHEGQLWLRNVDPHRANPQVLRPLGPDRFQTRFGLWRRELTFLPEGGFVVDNWDSAPTRFQREE